MKINYPFIVTDVWRGLEVYTPVVLSEASNNAVSVTVANRTGRGILVSVFAQGDLGNGERIIVTITIDGTVVVNAVPMFYGDDANTQMGSGITLMFGYDTSCLVQMRGSGAISARYGAVMNEE